VVVVFDDPAMLDEETLRFIDTVVGITALALDRQQARSLVPRSSGPIETSRGPELELFSKSIAQELLGPAGALVVQHEELTQIHQRIRALSDPRDSGLAEDLSDLGAVAAEMGSVAERLRDTVAGLMTAGAEPATPARLDLGELVLESLGLTRDHLERRGIRLVEAVEAGCFALGRRGSLARVVQNLVAFAAESVAKTELPCIGVRVTSDGESAVLEVESNGAARVDETLAEVSKSVSTARRGGGIGLKLAIDVVAAHGGHVEVDARPGGGARLRVVLPAAGTARDRASSNPPSFVPSLLASGERRRILIVWRSASRARLLWAPAPLPQAACRPLSSRSR
jgi:signal transduction histidine kinase